MIIEELARFHAASHHYIMTREQKDVWDFMKAVPHFEVGPFFRAKGKHKVSEGLRMMEAACMGAAAKVYRYHMMSQTGSFLCVLYEVCTLFCRTYGGDQDKAGRLEAFMVHEAVEVEGCQDLEEAFFPVIQHGDLWSTNVMFK